MMWIVLAAVVGIGLAILMAWRVAGPGACRGEVVE
jgi:hypothetical protein